MIIMRYIVPDMVCLGKKSLKLTVPSFAILPRDDPEFKPNKAFLNRDLSVVTRL